MFRFGKLHENLNEIYQKPYLGKIKPFKIIGNVYFVGVYQASTHIIDTGDGLIMIDPGYSSSAYLVLNSIYELGFKPQDIKYIVNTHWHGDHTEATAAFKDLSGAQTLIGEFDKEKATQYFVADILIKDGDKLSLGNTTIEFMHTPGHTKGTISFFFDVEDNGKVYRVGSFGGAGLNTMVKERFDFDGCREAYRQSLQKLKNEKVDVFIGNHVWNNDTFGKAEVLMKTGENLFIDSELWGRFLTTYEIRLDELIKKDNV